MGARHSEYPFPHLGRERCSQDEGASAQSRTSCSSRVHGYHMRPRMATLRLSATPSHAANSSPPLPQSPPRLTSSPDALPAAYRGPCSSTRTAFGARLLRKWRNLDIPRPPQCTIEFVHPLSVNQMRTSEWCRSIFRVTVYVDCLIAILSK